MKTSEFIKRVEELGFEVAQKPNGLHIHSGAKILTINYYLQFHLDIDAIGFLIIDNAEELFDLACEYAKTPIDQRKDIDLTDAERVILSNVDEGYKWITRDMDDRLYIYLNKPTKCGNHWIDYEHKSLTAFRHLFQFIKWQDDEPYNIKELLGE